METKSNLAPTKDAQITFKKRGAKAIRRRPDSLPPSNRSDDPDNLTSSSDDELRQRIKRRKMTSVITASSKANIVSEIEMDMVTSARSTDRETILPASNNATKQSVLFKDLPDSGRATTKITEVSDSLYKGLANQTSYIRKNPNAPTRKLGPVKAPSNVRTITVLDYQPDVCKDYKTTGYCGFGDSCKFLHAREDYKQGWHLDKEWEQVTKGKNVRGTIVASANKNETGKDADQDDILRKNETGEDADQDDILRKSIPFACLICKGPYKNPISTKCGHYFCEPCALERYRKDPTCAVCGTGTGGVFNSAGRLIKQARHVVC